MWPHPKACAMGLSLTVTRAIAIALGIALAYVIDMGMTTVLHVGIALAWDIGLGQETRTRPGKQTWACFDHIRIYTTILPTFVIGDWKYSY